MEWFLLLYEIIDWVIDAFTAFGATPEGKARLDAIEAKVTKLSGAENAPVASNVRR